jgi:hypothetical protein
VTILIRNREPHTCVKLASNGNAEEMLLFTAASKKIATRA